MAISNRSGVRIGKDDDFGMCIGKGPGGVVDGGPARILGDVPTGDVGRVRIVAGPNPGCSTRNINNVLGVIAINDKLRNCATAFDTGIDGHNTNNKTFNAVGDKGLAIDTHCGCGCGSRPHGCDDNDRRIAPRTIARGSSGLSCSNDGGKRNSFRSNDVRTDCRVSALHLIAVSFKL